MIIKVDFREPPWIASQLKSHPLIKGDIEIATLATGDIQIEDIIIERKEPNDLLASIADGRLFNQCCEMRQDFEWCYVVICGQMPWGYDGKIVGTQWNFRSIQGALLQVQELGIGITYAQNDTDLAHTVAWLINRPRTQHIIIPPRKFGLPMMDDQKVLASMPGIGSERALELLKEHNLRDALLCLVDPKCKVPGIGEKTKTNIRQLFQLANNQILGVITND
jgi:ERCC4-type nuclease